MKKSICSLLALAALAAFFVMPQAEARNVPAPRGPGLAMGPKAPGGFKKKGPGKRFHKKPAPPRRNMRGLPPRFMAVPPPPPRRPMGPPPPPRRGR